MPVPGIPRVYLGIDPGASGGIAAIEGKRLVALAMPATEQDIWEAIVRWADYPLIIGAETFAVIERVTGYMPGSGGNIGSAMFRFGTSYGLVRMALVAAKIPFEEVSPAVWQRAFGIAPRGSSTKHAHKQKLKAKAQQLFPSGDGQITLYTADAVLLAEYCRRKREGEL